ncbi:hypothetical protein IVB56_24955 [Bradyrhizobium sp. CW7]|uniref:hypothetical protein n=1 Tax=Bradyrhizobium sp. CW7 TaxID=2782688 RepID=UPI001FFA612F|nr:hypothetical protein [Bradyrhizobium sp. CW7]MCK1354218.1 hypothetical protein [Bradyrhizobium sp. CW7]
MNTDRDVSAALNDFIAVNTAYAEPPSESSDPFNSLIPLNLIDRKREADTLASEFE